MSVDRLAFLYPGSSLGRVGKAGVLAFELIVAFPVVCIGWDGYKAG